VRNRPSQSVAGGLVARVAVVPVRGRLMRSQASGWAAGMQPRNSDYPGAQGFDCPESSIPGGDSDPQRRTLKGHEAGNGGHGQGEGPIRGHQASRRGTGGVDDCGTAEEDGPVTREALDRPGEIAGDGDPEILSDAPSAASGPTAGLTT